MNTQLATAGRNMLKELLTKCTAPQQELFKLMYGRDGGRRSVEDAKALAIEDCVDKMEDDKISRAIDQCEATVKKNESKA